MCFLEIKSAIIDVVLYFIDDFLNKKCYKHSLSYS